MKTKKLMKELMGIGVPRNAAREVVRIAREDGITNAAMLYIVCDALVEKFEAGFRCAMVALASGKEV